MIKNKSVSNSADTQPIDYGRLAKEVANEEERRKNLRSCQSCLVLIIATLLIGGYLHFSDRRESSSSNTSHIPESSVVPRSSALRPTVQRQLPTARPTVRTMPPTSQPTASLHICTDREVNLREGAGYSDYEISGRIEPGKAYPVVGQTTGENVFGNTTWYILNFGERLAYVTAQYTEPCQPGQSQPAQAQKSAVQLTKDYLTTCKDRDLLSLARRSKEFHFTEVRRATAHCKSKHIMVELKIDTVLNPLSSAKREIFALSCGLRMMDYGIAFDIYANARDSSRRMFELRAILARYEPKLVSRINCSGLPSYVNWEYSASEWWTHSSLSD